VFLKYWIALLPLGSHAGEHDRFFRRYPKIPRRFKRTPDIWVHRALSELRQISR
jgi:hypothetical protein